MASSDLTIQFVDLTGQKATEKFFADSILDPEDQAAFIAILDGVSDAAITGVVVTAADTSVVGTTTTGPYNTAEDKAVFEFQGGGGGYYQIAIPAPDETIFLPDKETVDPTDAAVIAFLAEVAASVRDPGGNALTFIRGYRTKTSTKNG